LRFERPRVRARPFEISSRREKTVQHSKSIQLGPGEGTPVRNPVGGHTTIKVRSEQSNGTLGVFETVTAPGEGPPLHVHPEMDEAIYVLEGRYRFKLEDDVAEVAPGAFVFVPRGVVHTWQCIGEEPGRFLVIVTPGGFERLFERFHEVADTMDRRDAFRSLGSDVGMEVVGPPLAQAVAVRAGA
jgi:quercetin dioxygenase-like cupin family protein